MVCCKGGSLMKTFSKKTKSQGVVLESKCWPGKCKQCRPKTTLWWTLMSWRRWTGHGVKQNTQTKTGPDGGKLSTPFATFGTKRISMLLRAPHVQILPCAHIHPPFPHPSNLLYYTTSLLLHPSIDTQILTSAKHCHPWDVWSVTLCFSLSPLRTVSMSNPDPKTHFQLQRAIDCEGAELLVRVPLSPGLSSSLGQADKSIPPCYTALTHTFFLDIF